MFRNKMNNFLDIKKINKIDLRKILKDAKKIKLKIKTLNTL